MEVQVHLPENFSELLKDALVAVLRDQLRDASAGAGQDRLLAATIAGFGPVRCIILTTDERVLVIEPKEGEVHDFSVDEAAETIDSRHGPLARLLPDDERERLLTVLEQVGLRLPTDGGRGSQGRQFRSRSALSREGGHDRRESSPDRLGGNDEPRQVAHGA